MALAATSGDKELLKRVLDQIHTEFYPGHQPLSAAPGDPETLHAFFPPLYAGFWAILRECVVADGLRTRRGKEPIAATVSSCNGCEFCTLGHTNFAIAAGADGHSLRASIAAKDTSLLADDNLRKVCTWATQCQKKGSPALRKVPPFSLDEAPEIIGTIHVFNYINRIVQTYLTTDLVLPPIPWLLRTLLRMFPFLQRPFFDLFFFTQLGRTVKEVGSLKQGASLDILQGSSFVDRLPAEFQWAHRNANVAKAFAYWSWAMGELAKKYIPREVTDFVGTYIIEHYTGETPLLSRDWVFEVAKDAGLSEANQSAVRYMLLMAFARFHIDDDIEIDLARHFPNELAARAMGMWAAFKTASTVSKWQGDCALKFASSGD